MILFSCYDFIIYWQEKKEGVDLLRGIDSVKARTDFEGRIKTLGNLKDELEKNPTGPLIRNIREELKKLRSDLYGSFRFTDPKLHEAYRVAEKELRSALISGIEKMTLEEKIGFLPYLIVDEPEADVWSPFVLTTAEIKVLYKKIREDIKGSLLTKDAEEKLLLTATRQEGNAVKERAAVLTASPQMSKTNLRRPITPPRRPISASARDG